MKTLLKRMMTVMILAGSFSLLNAAQMYAFQTENVKLNDKEAKIYIGTPVNVLKDNDSKSFTGSVEGFLYENSIYSSKNKALKLMDLPANHSLGKDGDEIKATVVVKKDSLMADPVIVWEEHEEFYYEMCTQCHSAHNVNSHTITEWEAIFATMRNFAQLYDDEAEYLVRYLKANASDGLVKHNH